MVDDTAAKMEQLLTHNDQELLIPIGRDSGLIDLSDSKLLDDDLLDENLNEDDSHLLRCSEAISPNFNPHHIGCHSPVKDESPSLPAARRNFIANNIKVTPMEVEDSKNDGEVDDDSDTHA